MQPAQQSQQQLPRRAQRPACPARRARQDRGSRTRSAGLRRDISRADLVLRWANGSFNPAPALSTSVQPHSPDRGQRGQAQGRQPPTGTVDVLTRNRMIGRGARGAGRACNQPTMRRGSGQSRACAGCQPCAGGMRMLSPRNPRCWALPDIAIASARFGERRIRLGAGRDCFESVNEIVNRGLIAGHVAIVIRNNFAHDVDIVNENPNPIWLETLITLDQDSVHFSVPHRDANALIRQPTLHNHSQ